MTPELEDKLRDLARILPSLSRARLVAIVQEDARKQRPNKRGPRAASHAKARQIAKRWETYRARHPGKSIAVAAPKFLDTLPADLKPAGNSRGNRKGSPASNTLYNVIRRGQVLNEQRPCLRRLVTLIRQVDCLAAKGTRPSKMARHAARLGQAGRAEDHADIKRLEAEYAVFRDSAMRALIVDAADSFVRLPKK